MTTLADLDVCPTHGLPLSRARKHFQWGDALCKACSALARKNAYKARKRDRGGIGLVRALYREFGGRWFMVEHAEPIARGFGVDARRLEALLTELGPGDTDPKSGEWRPGDGVVDVLEGGRFRVFRFDESWVGAAVRQSVALK